MEEEISQNDQYLQLPEGIARNLLLVDSILLLDQFFSEITAINEVFKRDSSICWVTY